MADPASLLNASVAGHLVVGVGLLGASARAVIGEAEELAAVGVRQAVFLLGTRLEVCELGQEVARVVGLIQLRLVRRRHLLGLDLGPVDGLEPRVRLDLVSVRGAAAEALARILVQQLGAQVARVVRKELVVEARLRVLDVLVELLAVLRVEGRQADEHLIDDGAERPPVSGLAVALPLQHLGREVLSRAAEGLSVAVALNAHLRQAEVGQLDVALAVHEDVLWLETARRGISESDHEERRHEAAKVLTRGTECSGSAGAAGRGGCWPRRTSRRPA